ncbi:hypothetical protein WG66_015792, partial [Moniliophthora roreri]
LCSANLQQISGIYFLPISATYISILRPRTQRETTISNYVPTPRCNERVSLRNVPSHSPIRSAAKVTRIRKTK